MRLKNLEVRVISPDDKGGRAVGFLQERRPRKEVRKGKNSAGGGKGEMVDGGRTGIWVKFRFLKKSSQVTGPGHVTDEEVMRSPGVGGKQVRKPAKAHFSQLLPTHPELFWAPAPAPESPHSGKHSTKLKSRRHIPLWLRDYILNTLEEYFPDQPVRHGSEIPRPQAEVRVSDRQMPRSQQLPGWGRGITSG